MPLPCVPGTFKRELREAVPSSEELPKKDRGIEELGVSETSPVKGRKLHSFKGTIGCTPNSVPTVFLVFSGGSWGL